VRHLGGDGRGDLETAGPGADHGHPLAGEVDVWSHRAEWNAGPAKSPARGSPGRVGPVELADGRDHGPGHQGRPRSRRGPGSRTDHVAVRLVPGGPEHLGLPPDVGPDPVLVHHRLEVGLELGLLGEELRPGIARLEAVAVEVVADVDPCPRVGVLPPGAADAGVLLDDGEGDAGLLQPDAGQQSRLPAADDHHREGARRRASPTGSTFRASDPSSSISSISIGTYSSGTSSHTSHVIISCSSSAETGSGSGQPWSR
jgi:hypothetical protein